MESAGTRRACFIEEDQGLASIADVEAGFSKLSITSPISSIAPMAAPSTRNASNCRGDTPYCSEECRQEHIKIDEAKEKNWNLSSMKAPRKKEQNSSASQSKSQKYSFRKALSPPLNK